jgi:hypothetical protein
MRTTTKHFAIMATLALFSTLTTNVMAQRSAVASMTIRATVVESASLESVTDMRFTSVSTTAGVSQASSSAAEFVFSGMQTSEVSISLVAPETLVDEDGNHVVFRPNVRIGNEVIHAGQVSRQVRLSSENGSGSGRASVWVEGILESENAFSAKVMHGDYIVSAVYN